MYVKEILLFLLIVLLSIKGNTQCPSYIEFCSQEEVDLFFTNYPNCSALDTVIIDGQCGNISSIKALKGIVSINVLETSNLPSQFPLEGLDSLEYVNIWINRGVYNVGTSLDKLTRVDFIQHLFTSDQEDLSLYKSVKTINHIALFGNGKLTGFSKFVTSKTLNITLSGNHVQNNVKNLIPEGIDNLGVYRVSNCTDISFDGAEAIKNIDVLLVARCNNVDLTALSNVSKINEFSLFNSTFSNELVFSNLETVNALYLNSLTDLFDLDEPFPALKEIKYLLHINSNPRLIDISKLDEFDIPHQGNLFLLPIVPDHNIVLQDNPSLEYCNNKFICSALASYPDSIMVSNNGSMCEEDFLVSNCTTSTYDDFLVLNFFIAPNPTQNDIVLKSNTPITSYTLLNSLGKKIKKEDIKYSNELTVNLSYLPVGVYYIRVIIGGLTKTQKIMKI